jgi:hypothetical protein
VNRTGPALLRPTWSFWLLLGVVVVAVMVLMVEVVVVVARAD